MSCCLLTATKRCLPLFRASQGLFRTASPRPAMDRNSPTKMSLGTAVCSHCGLQKPVFFRTKHKLYLGESAARETLLRTPSSRLTAAGPAPPGPAGQQGWAPGSGVITPGAGHVGSRGGRAPGSPPAQPSAPSPAAPLPGPPAAGKRPGPALLTCARRSAATPQAQTDRLQPRSASKRPRPGRGRGESGMPRTGAVRERPLPGGAGRDEREEGS